MSEQTDATGDRADDDDLEAARDDREKLGEADGADEPQPGAKTSSGDDD